MKFVKREKLELTLMNFGFEDKILGPKLKNIFYAIKWFFINKTFNLKFCSTTAVKSSLSPTN